MVIGIIGENCSGKTTLAAEIKKAFGAETVTGRDYLRMAKARAKPLPCSEISLTKLLREIT